MTAPKLELSLALSDNENTRPLLDGAVTAEGIRLIPTAVHPSEMFWRQLKFGEFDVSEMSMSSLLIATARGPTPWVALPVFTSREFFQTWTRVRADAGISKPADLRGKRVGVPEYQQTAAIWSRGILQHEFGVHAREIEWFMERNPDKSHGGIDRIFAAGRRAAAIHSAVHRHRRDAGARGARRHAALFRPPQPRRPQPDRSYRRMRASGRCSTARRKAGAISQRPACYPINHTRGGAPRAPREASVDRAQSLQRVRRGDGPRFSAPGKNCCTLILSPGLIGRRRQAGAGDRSDGLRDQGVRARCWRRSRNMCTSKA